MSDLDEALRFASAVLDERKLFAQRAARFPGKKWAVGAENAALPGPYGHDVIGEAGATVAVAGGLNVAYHLVLNDPAHILAEVASDRVLLAWLEHELRYELRHDGLARHGTPLGWGQRVRLASAAAVLTTWLARYGAHPDWKPWSFNPTVGLKNTEMS